MNLYCLKCLMLTKNSNTKLKREIDRKIYNFFSFCWLWYLRLLMKKEISDLLKKSLN